jgi:activator of HSP90 ATPase
VFAQTDQPSGPAAPARRQLITAGALALASFGVRPLIARAADSDGISHSAASIHQEPTFTASRQRLYQALTDPKLFDQVVELSGVMQTMKLHPKPGSELSPHLGSAFALFGGYITGRQVALKQNELIVQAWRSASWPQGCYSIARFELVDHESGSKIIFDHGGFPNDEADSLAAGWQANYWEPIRKLPS